LIKDVTELFSILILMETNVNVMFRIVVCNCNQDFSSCKSIEI